MAYSPYQAPFMAYNVNPGTNQMQSGYPMSNYQPSVYEPSKFQSVQNNGLIWVQGEAGAKSYLVAPGSTVLLMDSESSTFYLKSTDSSGVPKLRFFEYQEKFPDMSREPASTDLKNRYVTREEYAELTDRYEKLIKKVDELAGDEKPIKLSKAKRSSEINE